MILILVISIYTESLTIIINVLFKAFTKEK